MTTQAHQVEVVTPVRPTRRGADEVAEWYRHHFGWPVDIVDGGVNLILTSGLVGFELPVHFARGVLARLVDLGAVGPALRTGVHNDRVAFLCDVDELVLAQADVPLGVTYLRTGTALPLPSPRPSAAWLVAPDLGRRSLPTANAVLHAVRRAASEAARSAPLRSPGLRVGQARGRKGSA
ncbi:hypothetical protein ACQPYE_17290 [Actinosynnema sp. CA-299493]